MKKISSCSLAVAVAAFSHFTASAADTHLYVLGKGQHFIQTNSAAPVLAPADQKPFEIFSTVQPSGPELVTNAILRLPNKKDRVMTNFFDAFEFTRSFETKAQIDSAFPPGQYRFVIDNVNDGRKNTPLELPPQAYPNVPRILNFNELQEVEPGQNFDIAWAPFESGLPRDFVFLEIADAQDTDDVIFSSGWFFEPEALNGTNTSITIPEGTLAYDSEYLGRLLFVKRGSINRTDYQGAIGYSGYFRDTVFSINTLPLPPAAGRIQFSSAEYMAVESDEYAVITLTRAGTEGEVTVNFSTENGSATDGLDYVGQSRAVTFEDGVATAEVAIPLIDDYIREGAETVLLSLSDPSGGAVIGNRSNAVLKIGDNEKPAAGRLEFSAPRYTVSETAKSVTLTINRVGGSTGRVTANFETRADTATDGEDYIGTNSVIGFGPGITSKTITIPLRDDGRDEGNERFFVVLTSTTGGAFLGANSSATVVIQENDVAGTLSFSEARFTARENATNLVLTVTRTGGAANGVTVDYETVDDTATAGSDYVATSGTITFRANETAKKIAIPIIQDLAAEGNERFFVRLINPTGRARLGAITNANCVIVDDESSVSIGKASYVFSETNKTITIPVTRSGDLKSAVSVSYATANGTALAGSDYVATNGVLKFPANVSSANIVITLVRDHVIEDDETFSVSLFDPKNGVQLGSITNATVTIANDDLPGRITFSAPAYSTPEGTPATITIKRNGGVAAGVTVQFDTIPGTATPGTDYTEKSVVITFAGGEDTRTIKVPTVQDVLPESNETVTLQLSNPTGGATLGKNPTAVLTIVNQKDPNAIPAAGDSFMNVTITGIQGNNVSKTLNITHNPMAQEVISASYSKALGKIQGLTGSKTIVSMNGFSIQTISHMLQFPILNASGPGIYEINPSSTNGGAVWTYSTGPGAENHYYGTGRSGSSGTVIIDVLNPNNKVITGRFNFVAVQDGGTKKVRIQGSFRVKNVNVF